MDLVRVGDLRCDRLVDPLGIENTHPSLSWRLESEEANVRQIAYHILVASTEEALSQDVGDVWDSGRIVSDESAWVPFGGETLGSRTRVWWKVRVWTERTESPWSDAASWDLGLLTAEEWQGRWIGGSLAGGPKSYAPCPFLTRDFDVTRRVVKARFYATALGLYQICLNGRRVGDHELSPGWTDYRKRLRYQVFDVTSLLQPGANAIEVSLGDGWYCGNVEWRGRELYGDRPKFLGQLELTYDDDSQEVIVTDDRWMQTYGPRLEADILMGEAWDSRKNLGSSGWRAAAVFLDEPSLVATDGPPVRAVEEITPLAVQRIPQWPAARWIFDMGQNMVGRVRLRTKGEVGQTLTLRFGEVLDKNGRLYTENLRSAKQTDTYTCGSREEEVWESAFTFHGFRYVEISGLRDEPSIDTITGIVLHSDTPQTGHFECSDPLITQLQKNIDWGQRGNFVDVPTDCPQRDERLGWTGDAQVFVRTAAFNRDVDTFFRKYVQDMEDAQFANGAIPPFAPATEVLAHEGGPAWADAFLICPWEIYQAYGDRTILERHYPAMRRYFGFLESTSLDNRRCWQDYEGFLGFGDWLSHEAATPLELIGTAFFAHAADLMSRIAGVLGFSDDTQAYRRRFDEIRRTYQDRFVTPQGLVISGTQTAYVLSLHFDLMPPALRATAVQELVDDIGRRNWRLSTGFIGTPYLCDVLTQGGRIDVAYRLLHQKAWPSWLYPVTQGATTIWERWDGWTEEKGFQDPGMNSFNHYAYGAIGAWMYATILGISPLEPGYRTIRLAAQPGGELTWAKGHLDTAYGRLESEWRMENDTFTWHVRVPPNTSAEVRVPFSDETHLVGSGRYTYTVGLTPTPHPAG